jgi:hypothetical protein
MDYESSYGLWFQTLDGATLGPWIFFESSNLWADSELQDGESPEGQGSRLCVEILNHGLGHKRAKIPNSGWNHLRASFKCFFLWGSCLSIRPSGLACSKKAKYEDGPGFWLLATTSLHFMGGRDGRKKRKIVISALFLEKEKLHMFTYMHTVNYVF